MPRLYRGSPLPPLRALVPFLVLIGLLAAALPAPACFNDTIVVDQEQALVRAYDGGTIDIQRTLAAEAASLATEVASYVAWIAAGVSVWLVVVVIVGKRQRWRPYALGLLLATSILGVFVAGLVNGVLIFSRGHYDEVTPRRWNRAYMAYPHNLPPREDALSFRWALLRDTLHGRYEHPGVAWYQARTDARQAEVDRGLAALAAQPAGTRPSDDLLGAMDDLSVGLDFLHQSAAATAVQRRKAELLDRLAPAEIPAPQPIAGDSKWHYTTWANLGTHLVHGNMAAAMGGDAAARAAVREGLTCIERAIAINPGAHFGREQWQAVAIRYLLAGMERPEVFTTWDLIGNRYDAFIPDDAFPMIPIREHQIEEVEIERDYLQLRDIENTVDDPEFCEILRRLIRPVGFEQGAETLDLGIDAPAPFDLPTLAIIGMWQWGGGPNPWFALTLGNTMERVGQPYLAWECFARALEMQDRLPAAKGVRDTLVAHAAARQAAIEAWTGKDHATLQAAHAAESAVGARYQAERDAFEAELLGDDPHAWRDPGMYAPLLDRIGTPNTPPQGYDIFLVPGVRPSSDGRSPLDYLIPATIVAWGAALGALVALVWLRHPDPEAEPDAEATPADGPSSM